MKLPNECMKWNKEKIELVNRRDVKDHCNAMVVSSLLLKAS